MAERATAQTSSSKELTLLKTRNTIRYTTSNCLPGDVVFPIEVPSHPLSMRPVSSYEYEIAGSCCLLFRISKQHRDSDLEQQIQHGNILDPHHSPCARTTTICSGIISRESPEKLPTANVILNFKSIRIVNKFDAATDCSSLERRRRWCS
ncbi:hypothetical protein BDU57DRAFT_62753 [Ampelomyces quisqualis]|uniref:Uncharacterized protein n=1 Tax=Ampelomyces quisqualis TaxID=50730 RepID=A0A6A5R185_AMPQU|nr:hypothetical protein BDU57DRAFT_62753 [Ampelomyces quisqualis]